MEFNSLIPEMKVTDFKKSLEFYVGMLGFKIEYEPNFDSLLNILQKIPFDRCVFSEGFFTKSQVIA